MKKVIVLSLALVMVLGLGSAAFAYPGMGGANVYTVNGGTSVTTNTGASANTGGNTVMSYSKRTGNNYASGNATARLGGNVSAETNATVVTGNVSNTVTSETVTNRTNVRVNRVGGPKCTNCDKTTVLTANVFTRVRSNTGADANTGGNYVDSAAERHGNNHAAGSQCPKTPRTVASAGGDVDAETNATVVTGNTGQRVGSTTHTNVTNVRVNRTMMPRPMPHPCQTGCDVD